MLAEIFGMDGIVLVIIVVAVLFGSSMIPKLARNVASAKNEFEKGLKEAKSSDTPPATPTTTDGNGASAPS